MTTMTATMVKTDSQVQQDVLRELRWDTRVSETEVGVEVDDGVVTLTGTVSSYVKKLAAQEAAHRVVGVRDVANDIVVKVPGTHTRTDTEIAQAVRQALEWDAAVPHARITSTVSHGWVTLEGDVSLFGEREDAERAVRRLTGVLGVSNKIAVKGARVNQAELKKAIEEALERQAEREAERIRISVEDGRVSLSGRVRSWAEKRAILGAARYAHGVRDVEDHLRIEPFA